VPKPINKSLSKNESCNHFGLVRCFLRFVFQKPPKWSTNWFNLYVEYTDAAHRNPYRISRSSRKKKESYDQNFDYDTYQQQQQSGGHGEQEIEVGGESDDEYQSEHIHSGGKSGYSEGSSLRSIAQGSADQANSAVANQHLAAKQASYIAQNNLANLALQASATAAAALQGKQVLLSKIEQENLDAHQQLETELQQLRQAKRSAKAAQQVRKSCKKMMKRRILVCKEFCDRKEFSD
jgi:Protein of unknown function (DUF745)